MIHAADTGHSAEFKKRPRLVYSKYQQIGVALQKAIRPVCRHQGLFQAELFLNWSCIAGPTFSVCMPVKMTKKRQKLGGPHKESLGNPLVKKPMPPDYTLWLAAPPAMTSQLIYGVDLLKERIHVYFGRNFLSDIRFINEMTNQLTQNASLNSKSKTRDTENRYDKDPEDSSYQLDLGYTPLEQALIRLRKSLYQDNATY